MRLRIIVLSTGLRDQFHHRFEWADPELRSAPLP